MLLPAAMLKCLAATGRARARAERWIPVGVSCLRCSIVEAPAQVADEQGGGGHHGGKGCCPV